MVVNPAPESPPPIAPGIEWKWCENHWFCIIGKLLCIIRSVKLSDGTMAWDSHVGDTFDAVAATTSGPRESDTEAVAHIQRELVRIRNSLAIVPDPDGGK